MVFPIWSTSGQFDVAYTASPNPIFSSIASPSLEMLQACLDLRTSMIEGYQVMASENLEIAEETLPIALETWPQWDTKSWRSLLSSWYRRLCQSFLRNMFQVKAR